MTVSFPQMPGYRHSLALVLSNRASLLAADGDPDGAITVLEGARQQLLGLVAEYPDVTRYRHTLAGLLFNLGNRVRRDHDAATRHYVEACTHLDRLLAQQPDDAGMNELASRVALNLGITYAIDRRPVAADTFARARRHAEEVLRLRPGDRRSRQLRGLLLFNEGAFRAENGDLEAAGPLLAQAFEQGTEVLAATPDNGNRAAELLKWGVRYAQVTELTSPADGDTAWRRVTAAWRAMPERIKAELRAKSASDLDVCMLRRRQVAAEAHAGDGDARAQLEQIERQLTAIVAEPNPGAATYAELVLCRFDLAAAAAAAGEASRAANHRAAAERQLAAWPADLKPDQITRARLRARAADDPTARAAIARFLEAL